MKEELEAALAERKADAYQIAVKLFERQQSKMAKVKHRDTLTKNFDYTDGEALDEALEGLDELLNDRRSALNSIYNSTLTFANHDLNDTERMQPDALYFK